MTTYCPDCGRATIYQGVKPNFCGFCKSSLSVSEGSVQEAAVRRPARRDDRRPVRRPEPEPEYQDEPVEDYYDDEPHGRRSSLSSIKITLVDQDVKEKREPERTPVRMDEVFGGGALGAANSGPLERDKDVKNHAFTGGDKKVFINNLLRDAFAPAQMKEIDR